MLEAVVGEEVNGVEELGLLLSEEEAFELEQGLELLGCYVGVDQVRELTAAEVSADVSLMLGNLIVRDEIREQRLEFLLNTSA